MRRLSPNEPCALETLGALGVMAYKLDADQHETCPRLAAIRKVRGYTYGVSWCGWGLGGWGCGLGGAGPSGKGCAARSGKVWRPLPAGVLTSSQSGLP